MSKAPTPTEARNAWLAKASRFCAGLLFDAGYPVPVNVRVSLGWTSSGLRSKAIGECWTSAASGDGHFEVFISPKLADAQEILATLLHELVHAAVGLEAKHNAPFRKAALAVGLTGKMTATVAGDALKATFAEWLAKVGDYPAAGLNGQSSAKPKQGTRMLKVECACGYALRGTRKWLAVAVPDCPLCHVPMTCDSLEPDAAEGEE